MKEEGYSVEMIREICEGSSIAVSGSGRKAIYDGDLAENHSYLLEKSRPSTEQTVQYEVTPVETEIADLEDGVKRMQSFEGYDSDSLVETEVEMLRKVGQSLTIEPRNLFQQDKDLLFHVRPVVKKYRLATEGLEHIPGQPPEGSWTEDSI